jgi:CheY-like chemotaxis protein
LRLPHVSGHDIIADLESRADTRHIPIVVVTATNDQPGLSNVRCVLRKPVAPEALIANVERCLTPSFEPL